MYDILIGFLTLIGWIAAAALVVSSLVLGLLVAIYLLEEFKLLVKKFRAWKEARRLMKESNKSWEDFFFQDLPKGFDDTGEIIQPHAAPRGDVDDLGTGEASK